MNKTVKIRIVLFSFAMFFLLFLLLAWKNRTFQRIENYDSVYSNTMRQNEKKVAGDYLYLLKVEDGYVSVYYAKSDLLYDKTSIKLETLPTEIQEELKQGKLIRTQEELYDFLENFSS